MVGWKMHISPHMQGKSEEVILWNQSGISPPKVFKCYQNQIKGYSYHVFHMDLNAKQQGTFTKNRTLSVLNVFIKLIFVDLLFLLN